MSAVATDSPRLSSGYEIANALGRLNADRPKLGERCVNEVTIAKAIRLMLHALDLHQQATGHSTAKIARDIRAGRIEMRLKGSRVTLVMQ